MEQNPQSSSSLGFYSADGHFQPVALLKANTLEFASKSRKQLQALLLENIDAERYEKCALIRDELLRRSAH